MDGTLGMGESEVPASPASLERCHQSATEAYDQAYEPERIDPNGGSRVLPARLEEGRTRSRAGNGSVGELIELLGYFSKEEDGVC